MDKQRLLELAGMPITEAAGPGGKKYPVIVAEYDAKQAFAELNGQFRDSMADGEFPEGTKFTIDMITDEIMQKFVDAIAHVYDEGGSDDRRADNYGEAMDKILNMIIKANKGK
jgi:hypothetical protein